MPRTERTVMLEEAIKQRIDSANQREYLERIEAAEANPEDADVAERSRSDVINGILSLFFGEDDAVDEELLEFLCEYGNLVAVETRKLDGKGRAYFGPEFAEEQYTVAAIEG